MNYCVIIPTYNNVGTICNVVNDIYQYCKDIIVVNDGSNDGTYEALQNINFPIEIVSYKQNKGKGYALITGFEKAKSLGYSYAITIDADGQHFADDIPLFIDKVRDCPKGIIVGCRNLTEENMPAQNTFANRFSNFWFHFQTGIDLHDTQSGFRLYALSSLRNLKLITHRYESELELLVLAAWSGVQISTVPIKVYYPPKDERVSHFRPIYDFVRISILNTVLTLTALLFYWPIRCLKILWSKLRCAIYTIFAFLYFIGLSIECTIIGFYLLTICGKTDENKLRYHKILQSKALFVVNHIPGTTFKYTNSIGETFSQPSIIISNHQSHLDLMAIMMLSPKIIILTKDWVWHNPFYGQIIRYADFFPITDSETMEEKISKMVEKGYSVMIFPEGTRSADCEIHRFHRGAFYLAEKFQLDIVLLYIDGFGKVLPKTSFHLNPGKLELEVIKRVKYNSQERLDYREETKFIHNYYKQRNFKLKTHNTLETT